jgi:hypothetical protein
MSGSRKRVVVLGGAGLVFDAGLPLSIKLAEKLREYLYAEPADVDMANHRAQRSLYNLIVGGIRFQQGVLDRNPDEPINIEQIATAVLRLGKRHENPVAPYVSVWHPRLVEIEEEHPAALSSFLSVIYGQLRQWLTPAPTADLGYLASLRELHTERSVLDIFSLNYDLCIEKSLTDLAECPFVNGFSESGWQASLFDEADKIRLVKLHGSLDWVDDFAGYGICATEFPRHPQAEELDGQPPLLIFGTDQKMTGRDPFLTMFYHFSKALRSCGSLIIIGYSFGDPHINQIIEQRFRENIGMKVLVVAPRASEHIRGQEWLGNPSRVEALDLTAKAAINEKRVLKWVNQVLKDAKDDAPF